MTAKKNKGKELPLGGMKNDDSNRNKEIGGEGDLASWS